MAYKIPGVQVDDIEIDVAAARGVIRITQTPPQDEPQHIVEVDRVRAELLIKALRELLDLTPSLF